jgi:hypothetical protein
MTREVRICHTSVQRIWAEAGHKPHPVGRFKISNDPNSMTHDYKRHGTTTLFSAFDVKSGLVICECHARHLAKEFI